MSRLDFPYDESYRPAMPVLRVGIDGYNGHPAQEITALVDSGGDGTILSIDVLTSVGADYADTVQMRGILGRS